MLTKRIWHIRTPKNKIYWTGHNNRVRRPYVVRCGYGSALTIFFLHKNQYENSETIPQNVMHWNEKNILLFPLSRQIDLLLGSFLLFRFVSAFGDNGKMAISARRGLWHWPTKMIVNFHSNGIFLWARFYYPLCRRWEHETLSHAIMMADISRTM